MSIYCSDFGIGEDHHETCKRWVRCSKRTADRHDIASYGEGWCAYYDEDRPCTCGNLGPWVYQGSHILPEQDHPRGGDFELASIPNFITKGGGYDENGALKDWLRVSMVVDEHFQAIVIDRQQAEAMRDYLTRWLNRDTEGP